MTFITGNFKDVQLGRYVIQERIGMGGMARVFRGVDTTLDRPVAIKILHEHLAEDPTFKQRFEREAKLIASLNHPNITQIYDYDAATFDNTQLYYMVMPFIPGKTLKQIISEASDAERRLPHEYVLRIMLEIADGLDYAHTYGMIHRDVKPANILFNERGTAILTDFGIARMAEGSQLTQESVTIGTPAYMSPEQAAGELVDQRTDIYALGVILYEMLAGKPPYADDGSLSILLKHMNEPVPIISEDLPMENPALDAVVFTALAKHPEDRYQTAAEFAADLRAAFEGAPIQTSVTQEQASQRTATSTRILPPSESITQSQQIQQYISRSPLRIFALGMSVIVVIVVLAFLTQVNQNGGLTAATNSNEDAEVVSGGVSGMTGDFYFDSTFDPEDATLGYWPQVDSGMIVRQMTVDGQYRIRNELAGQAITSIFDPIYSYQNMTIILEGQLVDSSSRSGAFGIVFHYQDENNYNVFAVDGVGRYSVWVRQDGIWNELRDAGMDWTENENVNARGDVNRLTIEINDGQYTGYVNGRTTFTVRDTTFTTGNIGIYVAAPEGGMAEALINSYQVTRTVRSMTAP